jgi:chaperone required for assembly of F1-ATPase
MVETSPPPAGKAPARTASLPKRFYDRVEIKDEAGGTSLRLDGKPVRTPGKHALVLPTKALAEAVADEWRVQGERIDPATMPLTRLANSVIDGVKGREHAVKDDILGYGRSDLVCYRAEGPEKLAALQTKHWDPVVAWAKKELHAPLRLAEGVMHVAQDEASLDAITARLAAFDAWSLAALHLMTGLAGSALLALAVALGRLSPEEAWAAAHVDEDWQISQWGEDEEAKARRETRHRDFAAAARLLTLLQPQHPSRG